MSINGTATPRLSVGLVGSYPPPYGGVSVHLKALQRYLEAQGHACIVYNTGKNKNAPGRQVVNVGGLLSLVVELARARVGLFHAHGGAEIYKKLLILFAFKKLLGRPYLITIHSGGFVKDVKRRSVIGLRLLVPLLRNAEKIICVSQAISDAVTGVGIPREQCQVIPAFSIESQNGHRLPDDLEAFMTAHQPLLVCLGYNFSSYYGFELAIQAVTSISRKYPRIGLVIMGGDLSGEDFRALEGRCAEESLGRILFTGDVEHRHVLSAIAGCTIFLRPTYHDGDSVSVREALALGVPVIASSTERRPEGVTLFRTGDPADLVDKIDTVVRTLPSHDTKPRPAAYTRNLEAVLNVYRGLTTHAHAKPIPPTTTAI
jgi:glycogen synthase